MRAGMGRRDIGLLFWAFAAFALPAAGHAQIAIPAGEIISKLAPAGDADPGVDVATLKHQAADRVKAKADAQQLRIDLVLK